MTTTTVAPVAKSVTVNAPIDRAFQVFTESFNSWWPSTHHVRAVDLAEAVLEPALGGRWYERSVDGGECEWGRVTAFEPPHRLVLAWHLDGAYQYDPDPARASEVEVVFTDLGDGRTRVDLEHRALERHGAEAGKVRGEVGSPGGWPGIMDQFARVAGAA
jgi:uncharacterized protein YndB with AHSA1/START domain